MKCPKCKQRMKVEVENHRYICDACGNIINWMKDERSEMSEMLENQGNT